MWEQIKSWLPNGTNFAGSLLKAVLVAVVGILLIRFVMKLLSKALDRGHMDKSAHNLIKTLAKTVMLVLLCLVLASTLGIDVTGAVALASVVSLAVSLSLQNSLSNVIGGFTLLYTHPFVAGDYVEIASRSGTVKDVGIAYTRLITPDNKIVSIPNSAVIAEQIVNYSTMGTRRLEIPVRASYDAPVDLVEGALREAVQVEGVLADPAPFVSVTGYGESAINYVIRVWATCEDYWTVNYAITHKIKDVFDEKGICMTYPHLNVHLDK